MTDNSLLIVVLILVGIAVLMQAGAMVGIWLTMRKIPGQIDSIRSDLKERFDPINQSLTEIVANSRAPIAAISTNLAEVSQILREQTGRVDELLADVVDKSRLQVIRVDQFITDLLERVEATTEKIQESVLVPVKEVSAVVGGVRAGLEFLFSKRQTAKPAEATQDEQLFI